MGKGEIRELVKWSEEDPVRELERQGPRSINVNDPRIYLLRAAQGKASWVPWVELLALIEKRGVKIPESLWEAVDALFPELGEEERGVIKSMLTGVMERNYKHALRNWRKGREEA